MPVFGILGRRRLEFIPNVSLAQVAGIFRGAPTASTGQI